MRGSEKQLKWAEEIKAVIIPAMESIIAEGEKKDQSDERVATTLKQIKARKNALETAEYAGDVISIYGDAAKGKDAQSVAGSLVAIWRVKVATTDGEKDLLEGKNGVPAESDLLAECVKKAEEAAYAPYNRASYNKTCTLGAERKVVVKNWRGKRTYININCYSPAGNYKGRYDCGYIDIETGAYVKGTDIDLFEEI